VRLLRAIGRAAAAERLGWLTIAALLCDLSATEVGAIDPDGTAIHHRSGSTDLLDDPWGDPTRHKEAPATVVGTTIAAADPTDPFGASVAALAAACVGFVVVRVDGRALPSAGVRAALRARLRAMGDHRG
jgi:hypothetical protein